MQWLCTPTILTALHYYESKQCATVLQDLTFCIQDIMSWNVSNMLKCNPKKTQIIHFSSRFSPAEPVPSIKVGDCSITLNNEVKDLGVTLDRHLTFKTWLTSTTSVSLPHVLFTTSEKLGTFYLDLLRNVLFMYLSLQNLITATAFFTAYPPTS